MPLYRVISFTPDLQETVHTDVEAADAMAAALAICGGPLVEKPGDKTHFVAHVAPMNRPVDLRLFYRPPARAVI
jgi:hypothetical protein